MNELYIVRPGGQKSRILGVFCRRCDREIVIAEGEDVHISTTPDGEFQFVHPTCNEAHQCPL